MPSPMLDRVRVAAPCPASWEKMRGNDRVRYCDLCKLNVYNISAMTEKDAEALLQTHAGQRLCGRIYRRADGTVLTQDCPTGLRALRRRVTRRGGAVLSLLLGLFGGAFSQDKKPATDTASHTQQETKSRLSFEYKPLAQDDDKELAVLGGVLYDMNEAVITNARVWITDETGAVSNTVSDGDGHFRFASLKAGNYTLESSSPGFQPLKVETLRLKAGELTNAKITLEVGPTELGVVVIGEIPIDLAEIEKLPVRKKKSKVKVPQKRND